MTLRLLPSKILEIVTNYACSRTPRQPRKTKRALRRNQSALECMDETVSRANGRRNWRRYDSRGSRPADLADLEAHEPPDGNVLAKLRDRLCDHFADRHALILNVMLLVQ